jgi:hypothetical protein
MSKRGLTYPSRQLIDVANMLDKLFIDLHWNHPSKEEGIMRKLTHTLIEKIKLTMLDVLIKVVQYLVQTRTFIRLNNLNWIILITNNINNKINLKNLLNKIWYNQMHHLDPTFTSNQIIF